MAARVRTLGFIVGCAFSSGAAGAVAFDIYRLARDGFYQSAAVGEVWADIHANSLVGFGALVERSISPEFWFDVLVPLLSLPVWLVLAVPGAALVALCRPRRWRLSPLRRR